MPDRSRCPSCGQRVTPFAAGCAVCGADLDVHRWDSGPGVLQRAGSWLGAITFADLSTPMKWMLIGFVVVFIGTPLLAFLV